MTAIQVDATAENDVMTAAVTSGLDVTTATLDLSDAATADPTVDDNNVSGECQVWSDLARFTR